MNENHLIFISTVVYFITINFDLTLLRFTGHISENNLSEPLPNLINFNFIKIGHFSNDHEMKLKTVYDSWDFQLWIAIYDLPQIVISQLFVSQIADKNTDKRVFNFYIPLTNKKSNLRDSQS